MPTQNPRALVDVLLALVDEYFHVEETAPGELLRTGNASLEKDAIVGNILEVLNDYKAHEPVYTQRLGAPAADDLV